MSHFPFSVAVRGLTKSFGPNDVLRDVTFTVSPGDCIGIVAPNGTGKTTLLRVLAGEESLDGGSIIASPPAATIGYLPQEHERREGETLRAFLERRSGVAAADAALESAASALGEGEPGADDRYAFALDRYLRLGGPEIDARTGEVCVEVGLDSRLLDVPMVGLSGGQAARAGLAAILLARFDVLLLDEPTNDLDFAGLAQLEAFVVGRKDSAFVVVSHDRAFLERTVTSVLELDEVQHTAVGFEGGWASYLEEKQIRRSHAEERHQVYLTQRSHLVDRAREQRQWAVQGVRNEKKNPKDNDKALRGARINRTEKQASKARASERAIERLEQVDKPWESWELRMDWQVGERSSDVVAYLRSAVVERGDFRLGPVDVELRWGDRLAITGPNGGGKTTLVRALLGQLPIVSGTQHLASSVVIGDLDQQRSMFDTDKSCLDVLIDSTGLTLSDARSLLAKFRLSAEHVGRPAASLSPGERTRAILAAISARKPNLLILDEPTNHLDVEAIEQVESALDGYTGTVVLITHDRRLLESVSLTAKLVVEGGVVQERPQEP